MRIPHRRSVVVVLALAAAIPNSSLASEFSAFLREVLKQQSGRQPTGVEINQYSNIYRTDGPLESLIRMLASDDYFVTQCQRRADLYVTRLYEILLRREPREDELRTWTPRVPFGSSVQRLDFVRQFCQANGLNYYIPAPTSTFNPSQPVSPATSVSAAARALVAKTGELNATIQRELGATFFGRDLLNRSASLTAAATQYRDTVESQRSTPQQIAIAADNVSLAISALEESFRAIPGASATCQRAMWEVSQVAESIRVTAVGSAPNVPPIQKSPVQAEAEQLIAVSRQFADVVSQYQQQNPNYAGLYQSAFGLVTQAEELLRLARFNAPQADLQRSVNGILTQTRTLARATASTDAYLQRVWWNVQHEVDALAIAAGSGGDFYVAPDQPMIINHPGWGGLPAQPNPGYQLSRENDQIVRASDELIALLDNYVNSLRPLVGRNSVAGQMIQDVLNMRNQLLALRQQASIGAYGAALQYPSRELVRQYREVASRSFVRMVSVDASLNSPTWAEIGQRAAEIDRIAGGF